MNGSFKQYNFIRGGGECMGIDVNTWVLVFIAVELALIFVRLGKK